MFTQKGKKTVYSATLSAVCHARDDVIARSQEGYSTLTQNAPSPDGYGVQSPTFTWLPTSPLPFSCARNSLLTFATLEATRVYNISM